MINLNWPADAGDDAASSGGGSDVGAAAGDADSVDGAGNAGPASAGIGIEAARPTLAQIRAPSSMAMARRCVHKNRLNQKRKYPTIIHLTDSLDRHDHPNR
ncbi:MAG TPA: hypothetical protein VJ302_14950, partial [Blastocatellia bacterium]|nr:hypothetical protein [Blastocatellia bacterium]